MSLCDVINWVHIVLGSRKSLNAAYMASKDQINVSITSVYNKINCIETHTSAELVRYAASKARPIIEALGPQKPLIPGCRIKILDGNCIEAVEHRIEELRRISSGALPGKSLVVFDPALRMPIDVFPCEDGYAQERSLISDVIPTVRWHEEGFGSSKRIALFLTACAVEFFLLLSMLSNL